jgi:hypothetical protein|tara:strand:- start:69170 stop:69688 length:519 start_codon:yes stop_codon:yes gene_type:complete
MAEPQSLPDTLAKELGRITIAWASIEQNLILHASAMAAIHTDGKPLEYLRMDFKRLRQKWYSLCRDAFPAETMNKTINTLNSNLSKLSLERGYYFHGTWTRVSRGRYRLSCWEQKTELSLLEGELTLAQIRQFASACERTSRQVHQFCTGEHGAKDGYRATGEITFPLKPVD